MALIPAVAGTKAKASEANTNWETVLGYAPDHIQYGISATATPSSQNFANPLKYVLIQNLGSYSVFLSTVTTATTSDYELVPGAAVSFDGGEDGISDLYYTCDTGETADVRVLGTY